MPPFPVPSDPRATGAASVERAPAKPKASAEGVVIMTAQNGFTVSVIKKGGDSRPFVCNTLESAFAAAKTALGGGESSAAPVPDGASAPAAPQPPAEKPGVTYTETASGAPPPPESGAPADDEV